MVGDGLHQLVMHDWLGAFRLAELSLAILVDLASVGASMCFLSNMSSQDEESDSRSCISDR